MSFYVMYVALRKQNATVRKKYYFLTVLFSLRQTAFNTQSVLMSGPFCLNHFRQTFFTAAALLLLVVRAQVTLC